MAILIENGYPIFTDADGEPLEDGYIYIGIAGLNPITNPLQAYWDAALTTPATNIRTKGGYPSRSGSPGRLYTSAHYSIIVQDKRQNTVYSLLTSSLSGITVADLTVSGASTLTGDVTIGTGYAGTGITLTAAGAISMDTALVVGTTSTLTGGIVTTYDATTAVVKKKIFAITNWNMNYSVAGAATFDVAHGLGATFVNIIAIQAIVIRDDSAQKLVITKESTTIDTTNITLSAPAACDSTSWDTVAGFVRGFLTVEWMV